MAEVIVAECSRIYFDTVTSNREQVVEVSHVYRTVIGRIVGEYVSNGYLSGANSYTTDG